MSPIGRRSDDGVIAIGMFLLCLGLAFMRFVPAVEPGTVLFMLGASLLTATHFRRQFVQQETDAKHLTQTLSRGLLLALLVAVLLGMVAGHPLPAIAKSAVPFLVLVWALVVVVPQVSGAGRLEKLLIVAASVWAVRLIFAGIREYLSGNSLKWLRLTLVDADSVVPFPLVVIPLLLFSQLSLPRAWRIGSLLLQLIMVVWTGYRSQQLLVLIMILLALGRMLLKRPAQGALALLLLLGLGGLVAAMVANNPEATHLTAQFDRYSSLAEEGALSGRALERRFAIDRFMEYPLLGSGLGVQVPASITYASTEIDEDHDLPETVSYLHNGPLFLLMTGGLPFLLSYLALWVAAFLGGSSLWVRVALLALFAFIQVEATFLQVHFNVLLAFLVGRRGSLR